MSKSWPIKKLGELVTFEKGKKMAVSENEKEEAMPYIGIDNLRTKTYSLYTYEKNGIRCEPQDVLLVWDGAYAGTVGIGMRGFVGSTIVKVLHDNSLNNHFLMYLLKFNELRMRSAAQGAAVPHLNKSFINNLKVSVPPLKIQHQIVERLDAIKKAQELNDRQIALAEELFQSLLHRELDPKEKGWEVRRLGEISSIKGGKRIPKGKRFADIKTNHPYIRVVDFKDFSVDLSNLKYIDEETFKVIKNYTISKDEIYVSIAGTTGLIGIIPEMLDGANLTENAAKLIFKNKKLEKLFLVYFLASDFGQRQMRRSTYAPGIPKLALYRLEKVKIPLPSIRAQCQIVQKIQTAQNYKKKLLEQKQKLQELFESCLDKAMKGELVS